MLRIEFCKLMREARQSNGFSIMDIVRGMGIYPQSIYNLENGSTNPRMDRCFKYLNVVKYKVRLSSDSRILYLESYEDLMNWLKPFMKKIPLTKIQKGVGDISYRYLTLLKGKEGPHMSLEVFLGIADYLGYSVSIISNK